MHNTLLVNIIQANTFETYIQIIKTIMFANMCSQILTTASPICVKMAEVALTWSMDTAVCVLRDTQALTAKQVRLTIVDHYNILLHLLLSHRPSYLLTCSCMFFNVHTF